MSTNIIDILRSVNGVRYSIFGDLHYMVLPLIDHFPTINTS